MNKFEQDKIKVQRIVKELLDVGDSVDASLDSDGGYIGIGNATYYFDENQNITSVEISL